MVKYKDKIKLLREYFSSLSFSTFDLMAGMTSTLIFYYITDVPWIMILFPVLLTLRGDLAGVFTGVLTTSLHTGQIRPRFTKNTGYYYGLVSAILTLSYSNGVISSILIFIYLTLNNPRPFLEIFFISLNTFLISASISIIITSATAFVVARKGLDPDVYVYPIISVINDVLIGINLVLSITILQPWNENYFLLMGTLLTAFYTVLLLLNLKRYHKIDAFRKTLKEAYIVILIGLFFSLINGIILDSETELIMKYPQILVVYPAFIALLGNQGVVLSSQLTTELHIGIIEPNAKILYNREVYERGLYILASSIILYNIYAILSSILTLNFDPIIIFKLSAIFTLAGLLVFLILLYPLSILLSVLIFQKGLNPDNFMISIITTISDFTGLIALIEFSTIFL